MFLFKTILTNLILPPVGPLLLVAFGLWLSRARSRRWQHAGIALAILSLLGMLALSLPVVGQALMAPLESHPPITREQLRRTQAIVVLAAGNYSGAPEYGGDTVGYPTLERIRYAARLARESGLPVLVTGGAPFGGRAVADTMKESLEADFGVKVRWVENASRDTEENARFSAPLLKAAGVKRIALVTHAWHMPRAIPLFTREGIEVAAAPTLFSVGSPSWLENLLPGSYLQARWALKEYLGGLFYRIIGPLL